MMSGIGTGPILGRLVNLVSLPLEIAYLIAAGASLLGGTIFFGLHWSIQHSKYCKNLKFHCDCEALIQHAAGPYASIAVKPGIVFRQDQFRCRSSAKRRAR